MKLGMDEVLKVSYMFFGILARSAQGRIQGGAKIGHGGYIGKGKGGVLKILNACMYGNTQSSFTTKPVDGCLQNLVIGVKQYGLRISLLVRIHL